jgi:Rps23 Pro-64 3,4-dihydroxylase Tpa1-like proline 4-hydroxylase
MDVSPRAGTLVVFKSATVSHEVLATNQRRMCVVGWFNRHVEEDKEADHTRLSR